MNTARLYNLALPLLRHRLIPDGLVRWVVRQGMHRQLAEHREVPPPERERQKLAFIADLKQQPIAINTTDANEQHYELPTEFFEIVLGPRLKYSSCYWPSSVSTLAGAEEAMLRLSANRAHLQDGQRVLDLGCGWGSMTFFVAETFPNSHVTGVSNSHSQREFIMGRAQERGLTNIEVITADMNDFQPGGTFDRVISVEMFEHMKNYQKLLARIATWLVPGGKLFVHIFTHEEFAYPFEQTDDDWMATHFFSGGNMPSDDLLTYFQDDLALAEQWRLPGTHYAKTLWAWLETFDANLDRIRPIFERVYGDEAERWIVNWRLFFLGGGQVFALREGSEYQVSHYLFEKPV